MSRNCASLLKVKSLFLMQPEFGRGRGMGNRNKEVLRYNKRKASTKAWVEIGVNSLLGLMESNYG